MSVSLDPREIAKMVEESIPADLKGVVKRIPVVMQFDSSDCGVACASSICSYYGKNIGLSRIRALMGTDAYGTSVKGLMNGLQGIGFETLAVDVPKESIGDGDYTMPAIVRVILPEGLAHYVVLYSVSERQVTLMDPSEPRPVKKPLKDFLEQFDGTMVLLAPTEKFHELESDKRNDKLRFHRIIEPHWKLFAAAIGISVLISLFGIVMTDFNRTLIDDLIPDNNKDALISAGLTLLAVTLVYLAFNAARTHIILIISQRIEKALSFGYFRHIFKLPTLFFSTRKTGDVITRFQDSSVVKNILTATTLSVGIDVSMAAIVGAYMFTVSSQLFLIPVTVVCANAILVYLFKEPYRKINHRSMEQNSRLNSKLIDYLSGIETVKATSSESMIMDTVEDEYVKTLKNELTEGILTNAQNTLSQAVILIGNLATLVIGGLLAIDGFISIGTLVAFIALTTYFINPVQRIVQLQLSLQEVRISMLRLSEVYNVAEEDNGGIPDDPYSGDITDVSIENIKFGYGMRDPIIKDVNIHLSRGEKIALVGRSGCGKTTLTKILMKMYEPLSGRILYNGIDLANINASNIRKHIGYVPQTVHTFSGSIKENITIGAENVSQEELDYICEITGCDSFIKRLPAGYDSYLDDRGGGLSGGEKQRLAIARALVRRPSFLIFDEATSNMDYLTERLTYDLMFEKLKDIPMLIVAHRLSTIRKCDRIYVLSDGKIAEQGTHEELIKANGLYAEMWEKQVGHE